MPLSLNREVLIRRYKVINSSEVWFEENLWIQQKKSHIILITLNVKSFCNLLRHTSL